MMGLLGRKEILAGLMVVVLLCESVWMLNARAILREISPKISFVCVCSCMFEYTRVTRKYFRVYSSNSKIFSSMFEWHGKFSSDMEIFSSDSKIFSSYLKYFWVFSRRPGNSNVKEVAGSLASVKGVCSV
jgi:hypothetical protein